MELGFLRASWKNFRVGKETRMEVYGTQWGLECGGEEVTWMSRDSFGG